MTISPASGFHVISLVLNPSTQKYTATLAWNLGTTTSPGTDVMLNQWVDVTNNASNFGNWNCAATGNFCLQVSTSFTAAQITGLSPATQYYWRVNEQWSSSGLPNWYPGYAAPFVTPGTSPSNISPATNLHVASEIVNPFTGTYCVTFTWINGTSTSSSDHIIAQFLDITSNTFNFNNWDCNAAGNICHPVGTTDTVAIVCDVPPGQQLYWRINEQWTSSAGTTFYPTAAVQFFTGPDNPTELFPPSILPNPPFAQAAATSILPPPPYSEAATHSIIPGLTAFIGTPTPEPITPDPGGPVPPGVLNAIWNASGLPGQSSLRHGDALAVIIAIAKCESELDPTSCTATSTSQIFVTCYDGSQATGRPCGNGFGCAFGLFQLYSCCGQGLNLSLAQLTDPVANSSVGVPPILIQIGIFASLDSTNYSQLQVENMSQYSGHPGAVTSDTSTLLADPTTLSNAAPEYLSTNIAFLQKIYHTYQAIRTQVAAMNFPVSATTII